MQLTPQQKIKEAVDAAKVYPSAIVEYYFDTPVEDEWFEGHPHKENKEMTLNTAKFIYKMV
jgi:hypothetical protein